MGAVSDLYGSRAEVVVNQIFMRQSSNNVLHMGCGEVHILDTVYNAISLFQAPEENNHLHPAAARYVDDVIKMWQYAKL